MKRFLGELIGVLLIFALAFSGCVGPNLTLKGDNLSSIQSALKLTDGFKPDKNGFKVLGIPSKENPTETYVIFKNSKGDYGFGLTCSEKGTILVMSLDGNWIAWKNGMVMPLSLEEAKDLWKDYVEEVKKFGDFKKIGRFKEPPPEKQINGGNRRRGTPSGKIEI